MSNKHSPFAIHNLNPGLITEVNDAYQRNVEAGRVVSDEFTDGVAVESLADLLHYNAAVESHQLDSLSMENIESFEIYNCFEKAFADAEKLFARNKLEVPEPDEFARAGVNFRELAKKYQDMMDANQQPQIVIAPAHGVLNLWMDLYFDLAHDATLANNMLNKNNYSSALVVDNTIANNWSLIDTTPLSRQSNPIVAVDRPSDNLLMDVPWTIRLISANLDPDVDLSYTDTQNKPTVAEYLTLQATLIQNGQRPVDDYTMTWLDGTIPNLKDSGIIADWDSNGPGRKGSVTIMLVEEVSLEIRDGVHGSRLPVW